MTLTNFILSIFLDAPAAAGASASINASVTDTVTGNDAFIEMIRAVGKVTDNDITTPSVTMTPRGRYVVFPGDTIPETFRPTDKNTLGALDYLSTVYEDNDYYESGYWGLPDLPLEQIVYYGPLPSCGLEDFVTPVSGYVTSDFGYREKFQRFHKGIDLHLCPGDTIRASLPGRVTRTGYERGGYGHFVIIAHSNGVETRYAHLQCSIAKAGDQVTAGQPIALGGSSGNSTGPHLHFEFRYMGKAVDPRSIYNFGQNNGLKP